MELNDNQSKPTEMGGGDASEQPQGREPSAAMRENLPAEAPSRLQRTDLDPWDWTGERARCAAIARTIESYYSTKIFRELTDEETAWVHAQRPGLMDRLSAAMGRLVAHNIAEAIERDDNE